MGRTNLLNTPNDEQSQPIERVARRGSRNYVIGLSAGLVAGTVAGLLAGESLNEYIGFLKEAPRTLQYAVDGGLALICGFTGTCIGSSLGNLFTIRSAYKSFTD